MTGLNATISIVKSEYSLLWSACISTMAGVKFYIWLLVKECQEENIYKMDLTGLF